MGFSAIKKRLCAIVAIPVTPFNDDGTANFDAYRQNVRRMIEVGIDIITPNGNTGEFYALTPEEQQEGVKAAVDATNDDGIVVAGIGFDVQTAINMGRFAETQGAAAVMIHQPVHPYRSIGGWLAYHQQIAEALPNIGIVPYLREATITGELLHELAERCLNFIGVKYAVPNLLQFSEAVAMVGPDRLTWVCGLAELWAPFFWVGGARGFTSGLVNVRPALSLDMLRCLRQGDYDGAQAVSTIIRPFEALRARRNSALNVPVVKEALAQMNLASRTVRPPISELSASERAEVSAMLATWQTQKPI